MNLPKVDLHEMPGHLIRRVHQISTALFSAECATYDLTSVQYAALAMIRQHPDVDATRLSSLIAFDRSTLGGVLDRLEAKSWISRHASPSDRRARLLRLTPTGKSLLKRVEPAVLRVQQRMLEPLSIEDRLTVVQLLEKLANAHNDLLSAPLRTLSEKE